MECFGIVGMAMVNVKDGLVKLLKRDNLTRGVNVQINDNKITLSFHVIVSYGVSISAVSENLISNVKYKVEEFTGMTIEKINIFVEGVRVIDYLQEEFLEVMKTIDVETVSYTHLDVYKRQGHRR